jgi:hypothetical protein
MVKPNFTRQPLIVLAIWAFLLLECTVALLQAKWSLAFIAFSTFGLSLLPVFFQQRFAIMLPVRFFAGIVLFIFATIFLGEARGFYDRYWWWDILLHAGSALGFGLLGFLFVFMLFEGNKYAAPAWAVSFISFCMALSIGTMWEIFEFVMDQTFGLNMQKSGLTDTMVDLIVDMFGAGLGALSGFLFLKGLQLGGLTGVLQEFIQANRRFFRRRR